MRTLADLAAFAVLAIACGHRGSPRPRDPTPPVQPPPRPPRPVETTTATTTSARILISVGAEPPATWIDVLVDGTTADAQTACEVLVRHQLRAVAAPIRFTLGRACEQRALPEMARISSTSYLLVTSRPIVVADLLLAGEPAPTSTGTIVQHSRHASQRRCQDARRVREQRAASDRVDTLAATRDFLAREIANREAQASRSCTEARTRADECRAMKVDRASVSAACDKSPRSRRCDLEQDHAMKRVVCETTRDQAQRECAMTTEGIGELRARLAAVGAEATNTSDHGVCRPE